MQEENTRILIVIVIGILMLLGLAVAMVAFLWAFQRRRFAHFREKERLQAEFQQELLRSSLEIREATHSMIGRELHDNVGQILAVARLYVSGIADELEGDRKEKADKAEQMIRKAMSDLRGISHSLNAETIQARGLPAALGELALQVTQSGKFHCGFQREGTPFEMEGPQQVILFRICQELINNAIRHSGAEEIAIRMRWEPDTLNITVRDNGKGFVPAEVRPGQGITNIQSRSKLLNAEFSLSSKPGKGTEATILYTPRYAIQDHHR